MVAGGRSRERETPAVNMKPARPFITADRRRRHGDRRAVEAASSASYAVAVSEDRTDAETGRVRMRRRTRRPSTTNSPRAKQCVRVGRCHGIRRRADRRANRSGSRRKARQARQLGKPLEDDAQLASRRHARPAAPAGARIAAGRLPVAHRRGPESSAAPRRAVPAMFDRRGATRPLALKYSVAHPRTSMAMRRRPWTPARVGRSRRRPDEHVPSARLVRHVREPSARPAKTAHPIHRRACSTTCRRSRAATSRIHMSAPVSGWTSVKAS